MLNAPPEYWFEQEAIEKHKTWGHLRFFGQWIFKLKIRYSLRLKPEAILIAIQ